MAYEMRILWLDVEGIVAGVAARPVLVDVGAAAALAAPVGRTALRDADKSKAARQFSIESRTAGVRPSTSEQPTTRVGAPQNTSVAGSWRPAPSCELRRDLSRAASLSVSKPPRFGRTGEGMDAILATT